MLLFEQADSIAVSWSTILETGAATSLQDLIGKPFLALGPQLDPASWWLGSRGGAEEKDEVPLFLDQVGADKGDRSTFNKVVFHADDSSHDQALFPGLSRIPHHPSRRACCAEIPFVLAIASQEVTISFELRSAVQSSKGLLTGFYDQVAVLEHPAAGWLLIS